MPSDLPSEPTEERNDDPEPDQDYDPADDQDRSTR